MKALIALSGGVDSSVAAFCMQNTGYDCIGVTLRLFEDAPPAPGRCRPCCSLEDVNDARAVATRLGMPHYVLNFCEDFKRSVIEPFIATYREGQTPNPCIECNRRIKFETLFLRTRQLAFDYLVTGHYARIEKSGSRFLLKKAVDTAKDQSYVLYMLNQEQLAGIQFPLGTMTKSAVREIAAAQSLATAKKHDSQDICFAPDGDYARFIEQYTGIPCPAGDIMSTEGVKVGTHHGLIRYTLGQRRGLGLSFNTPRYVCAKDPAHNTITIGGEEALYTQSLCIQRVNLIACERLTSPLRVQVKTRYLQKAAPAVAEQLEPDRIRVRFDKPQRAITPGQSAVLYEEETVIGGGIIVPL
ncbi:MAG: tRNA 2-thiouridine(34) synthase MnmA [Spirochaetaceae bacterium]|jgi:tRNA-specific 2-thiouridylase|nr:tRNA 2-thiouridine(34) synthase MnmA [Spirochaetaceae bacterium]